MALITQARFIMAQWKRGKGYYGAHTHEVPIAWADFRRVQCAGLEKPFAKARYVHYLVSWWCHHDREPALTDLHDNLETAETILDEVRGLVNEELRRVEEMAK